MKTKSLFIYTLTSFILSLSLAGKVLSQEGEVEPISITPKVTVDDVLSAGAEKVQNAKHLRSQSTELLIRQTRCYKNSSKLTNRLKICAFTILSLKDK